MITVKCLRSLKSPLKSIISSEIVSDSEILFIVPETSKASVERELFNIITAEGKKNIKVGDKIVTSGIVRQDVLSFLKFAQRIVSNSGDDSITGFDDIMLRNVIYNILVKHGSEFKNISKFVNKFEYIDKLISILGDFTRYGITPDVLDEAVNDEDQEDDAFTDKIYDLKLLMGYILEINEEYGFSLLESDLGRASDFIERALAEGNLPNKRIYYYLRSLRKTKIVIYGFGSSRTFTPQELKFLKSLDRLGCEIVLYVLYNSENADADVYYFGKLLIDSLRSEGMEYTVMPALFDFEEDKSDLSKITTAYAFDSKIKLPSIDGSVELFRMNVLDDELSFVCNEIIRLTRQENYRYRDIRVFCPDDSVTEKFKGVMRLFGLDAFIDKRMILDNTPVMRLTELFVDLPIYGYPVDFVVRLLRTGLLPVRAELVDYFENYCLKENIRFSDRIFDESQYKKSGIKDSEKFKMYYEGQVITEGGPYIWDNLVKPILLPLKEASDKVFYDELISAKAKDLLAFIDSLRRNLEALRNEYVDKGDSLSASLLVRSYKEVMILLTSFKTELNDVDVTAEVFSSLLKIDMKNKVLATIPLTVDSIEIIDFDSACYTPCKVLFVIGCNSSNFPYSSRTEGILSNSELIKLNSKISIDLPDKIQTKSKEDFIKSALIINASTDSLIMINTEPELESEVFGFINSCYTESIDKYVEFATPVYGLAVDKAHNINNSHIEEETMIKLLKDGYYGSVSSFETFNYCALHYMLENVLKIRKRDDGTRVKLNEIGIVAHSMFENAFKEAIKEYKSAEEMSAFREKLNDENYIDELSKTIYLKAVGDSEMPDRYSLLYSRNLGSKAGRIFKRAFPKLVDYCIESGYLPCEFEQSLEKLENRLQFTTSNGIPFSFNGYIDRVDFNQVLDNLRIVDYKTGKKSVDKEKLAAGLQFQLFAYALAEIEQGREVDNVGYVEVGLRPKTENDDGTDFSFKVSDFTHEEVQSITSAVKDLIAKNCEQISKGKGDALINPKGVSNKWNMCGFCPYKGICGNDQDHLRKDKTDYDLNKDDYKKEKGNGTRNDFFIDLLKKRGEM